MFNWNSCIKKAISFSTRFSAFLLSFISFASLSSTNFTKIVFLILMFSETIDSLTITHRSQMNLYKKRVERGVLILTENNKIVSSIFIKPNLKGFDHSFLIESNGQVGFNVDYRGDTKDGHFLIEPILKKTITRYTNKLLLENEIVVIKNFYSNRFICMNSEGIIYSQTMLGESHSRKCEWFLEKTAYGIRFINFLYSKNIKMLWFMAICKKQNNYALCKHVGQKNNIDLNTFWTVGKLPSLTLEEIPFKFKRQRFNYQSILSSIQEKSLILCNEIKNDLTNVTFNDIQESLKIITIIKSNMAYLRFLLLSHSFSRRNIKIIFEKIKTIILFYGYKTKKKLFRIFRNSHRISRCSIQYLKFCTTFRTKKKIYKEMRNTFLETNKFLIRSIIRITNLNLYEKSKWLKSVDFFDFIRNTLTLSLPSKDKIMKANYFILHYLTNEKDPFNINSQQYQNAKYFEIFFTKKLEELSYGAAISLSNSSIQILDNIYEKFTLLNDKNLCFKNVQQILHKHSRCSNTSYLEPCLLFSSKIRLYKG